MRYGIIITVLSLRMVRRCDTSRCYDLTCYKENCLQEAVEANTVSSCQMDETFGCSYTKMVTSTVRVIAKCSSSNCVPLHSAPTQETLCCTDELCNNGTHTPDKSSTVHCHSYTCTTDWDCLQKGIKAGFSRTCAPDTRYGCFVHKSQSASVTSVRAGCSESTCQPISTEDGQLTCCTGNLCNDGNKAEDDNKNNNNDNIGNITNHGNHESNNNGVSFKTPDFLVTMYSVIMTFVYVETWITEM